MIFEKQIEEIKVIGGVEISKIEEISDRRTSRLIKCTDLGGREYACKIALANEAKGPYKIYDTLQNELLAYSHLNNLLSQKIIAKHHTTESAWILMDWIPGETSWKYFRELINKKPSLIEVKDELWKIGYKIYEINSRGVLHGDLQPGHIIRTNDHEYTVIDFGISQFKNNAVPFFGALVHYVSPEVASGMKSSEPIDYNISDEVYSFAALAYLLLSEKTPIKYSKPFEEISIEEMLDDIITGNYSSPPKNEYFQLCKKLLSVMKSPSEQRPKTILDCLKSIGIDK